MSWFSQYFGGGTNPATGANKTLGQIPGEIQPYYQPYQEAGNKSLQDLMSQYGDLMNNPGEFYNQIASGYTESPGYQTRLKDAMNAVNNASAAGGSLGTPLNAEDLASRSMDLRSQDFENYLKNVLGLHTEGLQGAQGLENQGFEANTGYANALANIRGQQSQNQYAGKASQNAANAARMQQIFGLGGALYSGGMPNLLPTRSYG